MMSSEHLSYLVIEIHVTRKNSAVSIGVYAWSTFFGLTVAILLGVLFYLYWGLNLQTGDLTSWQSELSGFDQLPLTGVGFDLELADGSVSTAQLMDGSITSEKIADDSVLSINITDNAVITAKIQDGAVSEAKLSRGSVSLPKLSSTMCGAGQILKKTDAFTWACASDTDGDQLAVTAGDGLINLGTAQEVDLGVSVDGQTIEIVSNNLQIPDNAITTIKLGNNVITKAKIVDGAVVEGKLGDGAITGVKLSDGSVATAKISNGAVTEAKIGDNTITSAKLAVLAVDTVHLADDSVTTAKILDGTVLFTDIASNSCSDGQVMKWNGTVWTCHDDTDTDTTYNTLLNQGLRLSGTSFGLLSTCSDGQILKWNNTSSQWECQADDTLAGGESDPTLTDDTAVTVGSGGGDLVLTFDSDAGADGTVTYLGATDTFGFNSALSATGYNNTNWDTAYGWGNHASAGYVKADGTVALTANWDIGDTRKLLLDGIRARDAAGLELYDGGGNGIFIEDGGEVGIGITSPTALLHLGASTTAHASLRVPNGTNPTSPNIGDMWFNGTNLYFREDATTSVDLLASSSSPVSTVYNGATSESNVIVWTGVATTNASGVATVYPTSDGTALGTARFTTIYSVSATAEANVTSVADVPFASVKSISADKKTIEVNVVESNTVTLGGEGLEFAPSGRTVYVTIYGE